jgi:hypothetical protein
MLAQSFRLSVSYFVLVFLAGVILGSLRVPLLQPMLGVRYAELLEIPLMIVVIWQAAQFTLWELVEDTDNSLSYATPIFIGVFALFWLMVTELATTALIRGWWNVLTVYFIERDYIAGPVYGLTLLIYAIMPWTLWLRHMPEQRWKWTIDVDETIGEQDDYCNN